MKMKDLSRVDFPREKLAKYGLDKLAGYELLAIILGSGTKGFNVLQLAKRILAKVGKDRTAITLGKLQDIKGLGSAKASQVLAVFELGRRLVDGSRPEIFSSQDIWRLSVDIRESQKEHFFVFYLSARHHLIERRIISIGTLNESLVHPREVFEPAVSLHAASLILAHNPPSGDLRASDADIVITKRLIDSGEMLGIPVEDHIIVGEKGFLSLKQEGLLRS